MRSLPFATTAAAAMAAVTLAGAALAHDGIVHGSAAEAAAHAATSASASGAPAAAIGGAAAPASPFPLKLGGPFRLTDHHGAPRTEADPAGQLQLVFFGYANCQAICSVALPLMGQITDSLAARDVALTPVMITVDPERDTVDTMAAPLQAHHPDFVGLTGTEQDLDPVYDLFAVEKTVVFEDPELGPVYAHGSHIYLLDGQGQFLTLIPPILSADRVVQIVEGYVPRN